MAVFSIQGWTDDLFPAPSSRRASSSRSSALDPRWPVSLAFADVGHPRAQNKPATWEWLNTQANAFLRANLDRAREGRYDRDERADDVRRQHRRARRAQSDPRALATRTERASRCRPAAFRPARAPATPTASPPTRSPARRAGRSPSAAATSQAPTWPGRYTALTAPLAAPLETVGLGEVRIPFTLVAAGVGDGRGARLGRGGRRRCAPADARRGAAGPARLRRRGRQLRLGLFGNHWRVPAGHRLRVDLAQADEPAFRRASLPSTLAFTGAELVLPAR